MYLRVKLEGKERAQTYTTRVDVYFMICLIKKTGVQVNGGNK